MDHQEKEQQDQVKQENEAPSSDQTAQPNGQEADASTKTKRRPIRSFLEKLLTIGFGIWLVTSSYPPWNYFSSPAADQPVLRMPFPAGTVVMCNQGNKSPFGRTHSCGNCLHALDFSMKPFEKQIDVVASADGTVEFVIEGVDPLQVSPGGGFGNQVRIAHENGYFTLYSHLKTVNVAVGDKVRSGEKIGVLGETGNAGYPHLHYSMHRGDITAVPPPLTVPIGKMITIDMNAKSPKVEELGSLEITTTNLEWDKGNHFYGSENQTDISPRLGEIDSNLLGQLTESRGLYDEWNELQNVYKLFEQASEIGVDAALARIKRRIELCGNDAQTSYYAGQLHFNRGHDLKEAKRFFETAVELTQEGPMDWIKPWSIVKLGHIATRNGDLDTAKDFYLRASKFPDPDESGLRQECEKSLAVIQTMMKRNSQ